LNPDRSWFGREIPRDHSLLRPADGASAGSSAGGGIHNADSRAKLNPQVMKGSAAGFSEILHNNFGKPGYRIRYL
jgi:hypothetical protein